MKKIFILWVSVLLLSGCGTFSSPSDSLKKIFNSKTNTRYYEKKTRFIVNQLIDQIETEEESSNFIIKTVAALDLFGFSSSNFVINKVAVLDLVDHTGKVPELGRYISLKIANEISINKYFKLAPRGDLLGVMNRLDAGFNSFEISTLNELGDVLKIEALIAGKIIDLGTNLDININFIAIKTGEIIASASASIVRSDFAIEMLRKY